jgi:hypothetical protein
MESSKAFLPSLLEVFSPTHSSQREAMHVGFGLTVGNLDPTYIKMCNTPILLLIYN